MLFRRFPRVPEAAPLRAGDCVQIGDSPVRLRVNARARCISLRLDAGRREVALTAPSLRRLPEALTFAQARSGWIADRLAELPVPLSFTPGAMIEVEGRACRLEQAAMRVRPRLHPETPQEPARLVASGDGDGFARAVQRGLRAFALERLIERTAGHCSTLGQPMPEVALQDARARWGSCRKATADANAVIRYSWRLALAPPEVLDYVAAHECAHLVEANHGPRFWSLVRRLYGDPAPARLWLKAHGARLHAAGVAAAAAKLAPP